MEGRQPGVKRGANQAALVVDITRGEGYSIRRWHGHSFDYAPYFALNGTASQGKQDKLGRVFTGWKPVLPGKSLPSEITSYLVGFIAILAMERTGWTREFSRHTI
jgi:hypothetical protein